MGSTGVVVTVTDVAAGADVSRDWRQALELSTDVRPFLSETWTMAWIKTFGKQCDVRLLSVRDDNGRIRGAALLTERVVRHGLFPRRIAYLNADGEPEQDTVMLEHNQLLAAPTHKAHLMDAVAEYVDASPAGEFRANAVAEAFVEALATSLPAWELTVKWRDAPYVDLNGLRGSGKSHLDILSANSRAQLRRSLREYEAFGPLLIEVARTVEEGERFMEELQTLHTKRWQERSLGGAFDTVARRQFHQSILETGISQGVVHLMRVSVNGATIGVLYNLHLNGHIAFYQSGFRTEANRHLRPGLVSHHLAISYYLQHGMLDYDFLVSDPDDLRYKQSLSTSTRRLAWITLTRRRWYSGVLAAFRQIRQWQVMHFNLNRRSAI